MLQQLCTQIFRKIKFRGEELISSPENFDFTAPQIADKQRQLSRMSHLPYFCREPKTIIQAENNNNRRKSVSNKDLSQFRIQ